MTTFDSLQALRRANPRAQEDFRESVDSAARAVRVELTAADAPAPVPATGTLLRAASWACPRRPGSQPWPPQLHS